MFRESFEIPVTFVAEGGVTVKTIEEEDGWHCGTLTLQGASPAGLTFRFDAGRISRPFWCLPSLFWGDNLQDRTELLYPRFDPLAERPFRFRSRHWMIPVSRLTQPIVAVYSGRTWQILETEPYATSETDGPASVSLGFDWSPESTFLALRIPECEEPYSHTGCEHTQAQRQMLPAERTGRLRIRYRWSVLDGPKTRILEWMQTRYEECATRFRFKVSEPAGTFAEATAEGLLKWHYSPENSTFKYTVAYDRVAQQIAECSGSTLDSLQFFSGWVSGWLVLEPLLNFVERYQSRDALRAVVKTWTHLQARIASPCGLWWSRYAPAFRARSGQVLQSCFDARVPGDFDGGWMADPHHLHLRTLGDSVRRAARSLRCHEKKLPFSALLKEEVVRQARQVAALIKPDGTIPMAVDARTGEATAQQGSASMIWISVWLELKRQNLWRDDALIERAAMAAGEAVSSGILYGAPEDIGECMSSEDIYIAVNTFCDLYAAYRKDHYLQTAITAASHLFLYRRCFHTPLPKRTLLGMHGISTFGADFASPKNNNMHIYGLDVERSLCALSQWTGDPAWRTLADDHWAFATQMVCLEDGHFNGYRGLTPEQAYLTNWACLGNSVHHQEGGPSQSAWTADPFYTNQGNMAGFSNIWCVAFVLDSALRRSKAERSRAGA